MAVMLWFAMLALFGLASGVATVGCVYVMYMLADPEDIKKYLEAPKKDKILRLPGIGGQTTSVGIRPTQYETEIM